MTQLENSFLHGLQVCLRKLMWRGLELSQHGVAHAIDVFVTLSWFDVFILQLLCTRGPVLCCNRSTWKCRRESPLERVHLLIKWHCRYFKSTYVIFSCFNYYVCRADILVMVLNFDASLLRKFLVHQTGQALFGFLVSISTLYELICYNLALMLQLNIFYHIGYRPANFWSRWCSVPNSWGYANAFGMWNDWEGTLFWLWCVFLFLKNLWGYFHFKHAMIITGSVFGTCLFV
jgi:hypothetical protein